MKKKLLFLFVVLLNAIGAWAQSEDMLSTPLTIEAIEAGEITFDNKASGPVTYRVNGGEAQTIESMSIGNIEVNVGDKVAFFGDNDSYQNILTYAHTKIACTADCYVYGNIMSLVSSTEYMTTDKLEGSFSSLFKDNVHLKSHPSHKLMLPATTLTSTCYLSMFSGCIGLTKAPELPATKLESRCYEEMFSGCTGLAETPELPATTLTTRCYRLMFSGCTNLKSVTCLATYISAPQATSGWLKEVAAAGTFTKAKGINWKEGPNGIPEGWTILEYESQDDMLSTPLTLEANKAGEITFDNKASGPVTYRVNGGEAQTIGSMSIGNIEVEAGDKVAFFGDNPSYSSYDPDKRFRAVSNIVCSADCYIYGNIMSLVSSSNFATADRLESDSTFCSLFNKNIHLKNNPTHKLVLPATTLASSCYGSMFQGCTGLTEAPELPATTLASGCYAGIFRGCTGLTKAPKLPATTLTEGCYANMFSGCTGLTEAPELPATTQAEWCYYGMFFGCTGLTEAPELPATTLANRCYASMFFDCTGLTEAPELPATTLADSCYASMFSGCTGLTKSPALPATTLARKCYNGMFQICIGLTEAPELPATTLADWCYYNMFTGCSGLTKAPVLPATTLTEGCYACMFEGCTGLTKAPELPATTLASSCYNIMFAYCTGLTEAPMLPVTKLEDLCYQAMFSDCTGLTEAPELPATTLTERCYASMFWNCTGLTKAPDLPATTLAKECYDHMFTNCSGLTEAPELPATTLTESSYEGMFLGCTNLSSVTCLATDISVKDAILGTEATYKWLNGVAATGTFVKHPDMKDWPTGENGIPSGWTIVDYDMTGINATTSVAKKTATTTYDLRGMKSIAGNKGLKVVGDKKILTK